eukprot:3627891-Alexandrium_andersonii.AAC.1
MAPLLLRVQGGLQRVYDVDWDAPAAFFITADASPVGHGGSSRAPSGLRPCPLRSIAGRDKSYHAQGDSGRLGEPTGLAPSSAARQR